MKPVEAMLKLVAICDGRGLGDGTLPTPAFLEWLADRLVNYGDSPNVDFIHVCRRRAKEMRECLEVLSPKES